MVKTLGERKSNGKVTADDNAHEQNKCHPGHPGAIAGHTTRVSNPKTPEQKELKRLWEKYRRVITPEQRERNRARERERMRIKRALLPRKIKPRTDRFSIEKIWGWCMGELHKEYQYALGRDNAWTKFYYHRWQWLERYYADHDKAKEIGRKRAACWFARIKAENSPKYAARLQRRNKGRKSHPDQEVEYRKKYYNSDAFTVWKYKQKLGYSKDEDIPHDMVEVMRLMRQINQEANKQQKVK